MKDKNIDGTRGKIEPELWRRMRISAFTQGKTISQWLSEAIELKLKGELKHEK